MLNYLPGDNSAGAATLVDTPKIGRMLFRLQLSKNGTSLDFRTGCYYIRLSVETRY